MKFGEAALVAIALLAIIGIGWAMIANAVSRNPRQESELARVKAERDRLASLVNGIYGYAVRAREEEPVADYIAGAIELDRSQGMIP